MIKLQHTEDGKVNFEMNKMIVLTNEDQFINIDKSDGLITANITNNYFIVAKTFKQRVSAAWEVFKFLK